ncbi:MAG TPA: type II secretion system F family protein [Gaiellaceae bacterium]|nr:type II secretion system F family protein [Gaiellaceae bacterium]
MLLLVLSLACLAAAVYLVGEAATLPARQRVSSVRRAANYGRIRLTSDAVPRFRERVVTPLVQRMAFTVLRMNPKTTVETTASRLLSAGLAQRISPTAFLAAKGGFALAGAIFGFAIGSTGGAVGGFLLALAGTGAGFIAPELLVSTRIRSRREAVKSDLPDTLDLLAVSVEAGLGFDGAISKVTEHMDGALAEELALVLSEMRVGESRSEALKKLSERVPAPEVAAFVRSIIQADQLGISLGRILRVQAADSRLRRQAAAEERAMKAPIKMLFPTVLFIFPAMFLVVLGPAVLSIGKAFGG